MDFTELTFGQRLRVARISAGLTQKELAKALGIAQNQISVWEAGTSGPKRDRLPTIAATVKSTVGWLLEGKGKPPRGAAKAAATMTSRKKPGDDAEEESA